MAQKGFFIDVSRCTGCRTCSVACADKNNPPAGVNFRRVVEYEGGEWKENKNGCWRADVFAYYVSIGCNQCADPACVKVCPTSAKRTGWSSSTPRSASAAGCVRAPVPTARRSSTASAAR